MSAPIRRRSFLHRILVGLGGFVAGIGVARVGMAQGPPESFDPWRDLPVGWVQPYDGDLSAHENLPGGASPKWDVIGVDRVLLGADTDIGSEGGTESLAAELPHSGSAVADHALTQPSAHTVTQPNNHNVTQPTDHLNHSSAGGHTHDAHTSVLALGAILSGVLTGPNTHSSDGVHDHGAHSVHTGTAVDAHAGTAVSAHAGTAIDAHAVTQPTIHAIKKFHRSYLLKKVIA